MAAWLQRAWLRRGLAACALLPLSWFYGVVAGARRWAYACGWLATTRVRVPVIVVGNVVAGGAGKTPVVMALVKHLEAMGIKPGVVSRGHGRTVDDCREVHTADDARDTGDEPLLIARSTGVPVFVAPRRAEAAQALLRAHPGTRVIVSDDGLQHLALARDIDICVFDDRGTGNGWLLPAGPLREAWPRSADFVLRTEGAAAIEGYAIHRRLAANAIGHSGETKPLGAFASPVTAVAAIARPQAFFDELRSRGVALGECIALADHADAATIAARVPQDLPILCTEKDAVKLWRARPQAWAVPLEITLDESFWREFDRVVRAKLSSAHGPETA